MANTCTVDNLLYILYLAIKTRPFILAEVQQIKTKDNWIDILLEVYQHSLAGQWSQGKITWLRNMDRFEGQNHWDTFGSEYDFVVCRLDYILYTERMSVCDAQKCPSPHTQKPSWTVVIL